MIDVNKYEGQITAIGPYVVEFLEANILVLFGLSAPEELAEFAVLHDGTTLHAPLATGDTLYVGSSSFQILAVGEVANANLANLGHLVVKFNGENEPEQPGDVCAEALPLPEIAVGMRIRIEG
ncbi:putative PTS system glucitol/sorbitol-specific IIA component [Candidatus Promineifilum breve]|uniref:PTS system glucitol/sorbitol-specific IIA component n=1 Tax=Candidatus Promineifilum breve TaxID=1806508 RepID=A0A160T174_9CHLR|nr:putative PTS system glucitol/sorbitol-specific IIA component [Candidatus Promineifilum breve]